MLVRPRPCTRPSAESANALRNTPSVDDPRSSANKDDKECVFPLSRDLDLSLVSSLISPATSEHEREGIEGVARGGVEDVRAGLHI